MDRCLRLLLTALVAWPVLGLAAASGIGPESGKLAGRYAGFWSCNASLFKIQLDLRVAEDGSATATVVPAMLGARRRGGGTLPAATLTGDYDRQSGTLSLDGAVLPRQSVAEFSGVVQAAGDDIALFPASRFSNNCSALIAARGDKVPKQWQSIPDASARTIGAAGGTMGGFEIAMQRQRDAKKTTCDDDLLRWAGQVRDNGIAPGEAAGLVQKKNLFRPEYFKPFFGKRFSRLGDKKRMSASVRLMGSCTRDARYNELVAGIGALGDPFLNLSSFSAADAAIAEVSHTRLQSWAERANEYLSALPADSTDPATVEAIAARAAAVLLPLWPAEQDGFALNARTELGRIVLPRIERQLQATLDETSTDDAASLLTLSRFLTDNQALIDKLNPPDQNAIVSVYRSKVSAFLEASLDEHNRMLTSLEPGREALQSSTAWYASHEALFALFPQIPSVNSLYSALVASRRTSFGGSADGLVADVRRLDDRADLDRFMSTYIIALDTDVTESAPVRAAVLTKHNEISAREQAAREQAYRESFFTAYELTLMTNGFGEIQVPDRLQAPDAQGVRFALVRARADRGYVRDTPFSVSGGGARAVVSVDTPRCSPEGTGYRCQYRAVEEITYSGLGFLALFLSSREMLEFNRNDLFEMTPDGWRSATVVDWLANRAAALARMQKSSRSNDDYWNDWEDTQREVKEYQDQIDLMITY